MALVAASPAIWIAFWTPGFRAGTGMQLKPGSVHEPLPPPGTVVDNAHELRIGIVLFARGTQQLWPLLRRLFLLVPPAASSFWKQSLPTFSSHSSPFSLFHSSSPSSRTSHLACWNSDVGATNCAQESSVARCRKPGHRIQLPIRNCDCCILATHDLIHHVLSHWPCFVQSSARLA